MATFTATPLYSYQRGINHNVLVTEFESGKEQRKYLGVRARTWTVGFRDTPATIAAIETFTTTAKAASRRSHGRRRERYFSPVRGR